MTRDSATIFALSSGLPPAAIAIIRVSGPKAEQSLIQLAGGPVAARYAVRRNVRTADGEKIDDALVFWFPGPGSATGEDIAEFHVHGSQAVIQKMFVELAAIGGYRPAEPGEFTRIAFENGKIDLTQAEAIDDLIHSDTDAQRRHAVRQLDGLLGDRVQIWRQAIIDAAALIEAAIDFSDEDGVPATLDGAVNAIARLSADIADVLDRPGAERLREGLVVAITGAPNVGKSTLINRLVGRDIAIVSPYAGTTRDPIEVACDFGGYPAILIDTAGLRESDNPVEQEGMRRARDRADTADLRLWLIDGFDSDLETIKHDCADTWVVHNKADLGPAADTTRVSFSISALTGSGISALTDALAGAAASRLAPDTAIIFRARHRHLLEEAHTSLRNAGAEQSAELIAEHLRTASGALGRLMGRVDVEDVLASIFRNFCIGK